MSYLNFAVEVAALPDNAYRISVQSPVGEATVDAPAPFTPEEIDHYIRVLSREQRLPRVEELRVAREFGERLFDFLFRSSSAISSAYFASLREAGSSDGLRIRLTVDNAGALSGLPWEFLRDPANDFLATSRRTPVVRYTQQLDVRPPAVITMPLRVLVMISAPEGLPALDIEGEWTRLQEATAALQAENRIALERLDTATLIALQRRLRDGEYHVFHYIGHSDYDPNTQQGVIVFENETDNTRPQIITAAELSRELAEESSVRLVVLNSCHSARRADTDPFAGISSSLVARGIPAVVAMQFAITDGAAKAFADEFYRSLVALLPLDAAVSEARRAIANRLHNNEWATPVLYMRSGSGVLFQPKTSATSDELAELDPLRRLTPRQIALFGGLGLIILALLLYSIVPVINPPAPTPTPLPALLPNLEIGRLRTAPLNPAPGQIFMLSITIANTGEADSGAFNWVWHASLSDPVRLNSLSGHIDNIPPGASKNISFPFSYGWWNSYSSQLIVDWDTEVTESDERDNNKPFQIDMARLPFMVDFSLLPSNQPTEPPLVLDDDAFALWNLGFALDALTTPECVNAPLQLVDRTGDIVMTAAAAPVCDSLPLTITIQQGPVAAAAVELLPVADGTALITFYSDPSAQQAADTSDLIEIRAGEPITIRTDSQTPLQIRRIDVSTPGQIVQLSGLTLEPNP